MALEVPTLDRMLFMTKIIITKKKKKRDGGGKETVQIYGHFKLLLAFFISFYVKNKVGGEASSPAKINGFYVIGKSWSHHALLKHKIKSH